MREEPAVSTAEPGPDPLLLENQLCFPLYTAARLVTSGYTPYLRPLGLTYTQYVTLMPLWAAEQMTMRSLCRRLRLDSGTLTPVLKRLEADGLVTRTRDPEDERMLLIRLTDKGRALRARCAGIPAQMGRCVALTPQEAQTLYQLLYRVIDGFEKEVQDD